MRTPFAASRGCVLRGALALALTPPTAWRPAAASAASEGFNIIQGAGWQVGIPSTYYRPKSRASTGAYDDTSFVAADYGAGRTASVSVTSVASLLLDSGDPLPLSAGSITSLKDLGKPNLVARLLAGRRDGDPLGLYPPLSEVRDATRVSDFELTFSLLTLKETATSQTSTAPGARRTVARTLLVPSSSGGGGYLVTAWASSDAPGVRCQATPCPDCKGLKCACPPPKCTVDELAIPNDELNERIVASLRAASGQ